jgi:hypothetical protein
MRRFVPPPFVLLIGLFAIMAAVWQGSPRGTLWDSLYRPDGLVEVEHYQSLREMALAADAVVVGRIVEIRPGREFGPPEERHHYAAAQVEVIATLRGDVASTKQLIWELPLPPGQGAAEAQQLNAKLPPEPLLLFLRNKATEVLSGLGDGDAAVEASFYRTVVSGAVFANVAGRAVLPIEPHASEFLLELDGASFDDLIMSVRRAGVADRP